MIEDILNRHRSSFAQGVKNPVQKSEVQQQNKELLQTIEKCFLAKELKHGGGISKRGGLRKANQIFSTIFAALLPSLASSR